MSSRSSRAGSIAATHRGAAGRVGSWRHPALPERTPLRHLCPGVGAADAPESSALPERAPSPHVGGAHGANRVIPPLLPSGLHCGTQDDPGDGGPADRHLALPGRALLRRGAANASRGHCGLLIRSRERAPLRHLCGLQDHRVRAGCPAYPERAPLRQVVRHPGHHLVHAHPALRERAPLRRERLRRHPRRERGHLALPGRAPLRLDEPR